MQNYPFSIFLGSQCCFQHFLEFLQFSHLTDRLKNTLAGEEVCESYVAHIRYTFAKSWKKTNAFKYNIKVLTDEIMDQIEKKTGIPKKQQRITHQSKKKHGKANTQIRQHPRKRHAGLVT